MLKKSLLVLFLLVSGSAWALPLIPVRVALDWYINPDHAPLLVAASYGYFAKEGLQVEFIEPTNTASARSLVLSNQADIGIDYQPETMLAISQGLPILVIGNLVPSPLSCTAVLASSSIVGLQDLVGKTLAYSGDPLDAEFMQAELKHSGISLAQVNLLAVHMNLMQVLLARRADAVAGFMRNVEPVELKAQGINTRLFYPEQSGVPSYAELIFFVKDNASNKEVLARFMDAVQEGEATLAKNPQAAWEKVVAAYPRELASSAQIKASNDLIWQATVPYFSPRMTYISLPDYQAFNAFMLKTGLLQESVSFAHYFLKLSPE